MKEREALIALEYPFMSIIECPHCHRRVIPAGSGECPSCNRNVNDEVAISKGMRLLIVKGNQHFFDDLLQLRSASTQNR